MKRMNGVKKERGIALLAAILALLLLSAIAAGMLYSSGLEMGIAGNYRDKQIATYAAISALQEAKDRIHPLRDLADPDRIPIPDGMPTLAQKNIIYLINPKAGEVVAPWDPSNKFADTDLCHGEYAQKVLGLSGPQTGPCSGAGMLPGGNGWYKVYDNSLGSYTGLYKQDQPLNYKWVRIMLKADNMTPVQVGTTASPASGKQVCWEGHNQVQNYNEYTTFCMPTGALDHIEIVNAGTNYTDPVITIGPPAPGGIQAVGVPTLKTAVTDKVGSISVANPGSGYLKPPIVTITGGGGSGATAKATIISGPGIDSASLVNSGPGCYYNASGPAVAVTGGGGSGAAVDVVMTSSKDCIAGWGVSSSSCKAYANTTQTITGPGGFVGTLTFGARQGNNAPVVNAKIINPGSGITSALGYNFSKLTNCTLNFSQPSLGYKVTGLAVKQAGQNYTSAPALSFPQPEGGTAPTGTTTLGPVPPNVGQIAHIDVLSGGSGYTAPPTVTLTPDGSGSGGLATAVLGQVGSITDIALSPHGTEYWRTPTVTITDKGGTGTGAVAKAVLSRTDFLTPVVSITALAETPSGTRAMIQMEAAPSLPGLNLGGALTLDGPSPIWGSPSSQQFKINGNDSNSCGQDAKPARAAIGAYADPNNPTNPTAVQSIIDALKKPANYLGAQAAPDIENIYNALGDSGTTPEGVQALADGVLSIADHVYTGNQTDSTIAAGSPTNPVINYVDGNLTASGNTHGYGILCVTGNVVFSGNWSWDGLILIIGQGSFVANGGGNGQINGTVFIAKTKAAPASGGLPSTGALLDDLGRPTADFQGGGGNGIYYDHCLAENYMKLIPYLPPPSSKPLRVLSVHSLTY